MTLQEEVLQSLEVSRFFQPDFCLEILKEAKKHGIDTTIETSGYTTPNVIEKMSAYIGQLIWDIKGVSDDIYKEYTGVDFSTIKNNLLYAIKKE
jgi:Pyruvate-formate lyase-activating enzyme